MEQRAGSRRVVIFSGAIIKFMAKNGAKCSRTLSGGKGKMISK